MRSREHSDEASGETPGAFLGEAIRQPSRLSPHTRACFSLSIT